MIRARKAAVQQATERLAVEIEAARRIYADLSNRLPDRSRHRESATRIAQRRRMLEKAIEEHQRARRLLEE